MIVNTISIIILLTEINRSFRARTSLLVAFRLTGVLPEPQTQEAIALDPVGWNMSRPLDDDMIIDEWVENLYNNSDKASVSLSVHVVSYFPHDPGWPAWGNDYVHLAVVATVEMQEGFVYSIGVKFYGSDSCAFLLIYGDPTSRKLHNLQISEVRSLGTGELKGYLKALPIRQSRNCSLSITASWIFIEEEKVNHSITVSLEVTYFNGAVYQILHIPLELEVLKD